MGDKIERQEAAERPLDLEAERPGPGAQQSRMSRVGITCVHAVLCYTTVS